MGPCEDCGHYHRANEPCAEVKCPRCGELVEKVRDECPDPKCPVN